MEHKTATTSVPIHPLLASRWSARAIDPTKVVDREQLAAVLEAARWAPSCGGDEPWRFMCWDRQRDPAAWRRALDCLEIGNREWVEHAPVLIASFGATQSRRDKPSRWGPHDVGLATENLLLQATASGLVAHPMAGFDAAALSAAFAVPEAFVPQAMIALGQPGELKLLSDKNQTREIAARGRRPLAENFFEGAWGRGFTRFAP